MPNTHHKKPPADHDNDESTIRGVVADIFAHRFVIEHASGRMLADLGKHNGDGIRLEIGDKVDARGEMRPSEMKVRTLSVNGLPVALEGKKGHVKVHHHDGRQLSPEIADNDERPGDDRPVGRSASGTPERGWHGDRPFDADAAEKGNGGYAASRNEEENSDRYHGREDFGRSQGGGHYGQDKGFAEQGKGRRSRDH
jgi:hypothetical protein